MNKHYRYQSETLSTTATMHPTESESKILSQNWDTIHSTLVDNAVHTGIQCEVHIITCNPQIVCYATITCVQAKLGSSSKAVAAGPQSKRKQFPEFSRLRQCRNYTFPEVITQKVYAVRTFIYQWSFHIDFNNITGHHCTVYLKPKTLDGKIQNISPVSTAVLHKYSIVIKLFLIIFPTRIPRVFHVQRNP